MKQVITLMDSREEFERLDIVEKRASIVFNNGIKHSHQFIVISDLDGLGWYAGVYRKHPRLSSSGSVYWRTECVSSITYKAKRFYGDIDELEILFRYVDHFQFMNGVLRKDTIFDNYPISINSIPKTVLIKILERKITSQEGFWKALAKVSYKDNHWKMVKFCRQHRIPIDMLKMACPNYEAITQMDPGRQFLFIEILKYSVVLGVKCNPMWSEQRMSSELSEMRTSLKARELTNKKESVIWTAVPDFGDFSLVNTEQDAFRVGEMEFSNCVYNCYWEKIRNRRYIVLTGRGLCVGYQAMEDGDILFDQVHGPMNSPVCSETREQIDAFLRPLIQEMVANNQRTAQCCTPEKTDNMIEFELPY